MMDYVMESLNRVEVGRPTLVVGLGRYDLLPDCRHSMTGCFKFLTLTFPAQWKDPRTVSQNKSFLKLLSEYFTIATGRASMTATSDGLRFVGR